MISLEDLQRRVKRHRRQLNAPFRRLMHHVRKHRQRLEVDFQRFDDEWLCRLYVFSADGVQLTSQCENNESKLVARTNAALKALWELTGEWPDFARLREDSLLMLEDHGGRLDQPLSNPRCNDDNANDGDCDPNTPIPTREELDRELDEYLAHYTFV